MSFVRNWRSCNKRAKIRLLKLSVVIDHPVYMSIWNEYIRELVFHIEENHRVILTRVRVSMLKTFHIDTIWSILNIWLKYINTRVSILIRILIYECPFRSKPGNTRYDCACVIYEPKSYLFSNIIWRVSYWRMLASYLVYTRCACQLTRLISLINSWLTDYIHFRYVSNKYAVAQ